MAMREDGLGTKNENCQRDRADEKKFGGFTREDTVCTRREFSLFLYWCPGLILVTQRSCFNCRRRLLCSVSYFVSGTMGIGFKYRIDRKGIVRYDSLHVLVRYRRCFDSMMLRLAMHTPCTRSSLQNKRGNIVRSSHAPS
jgi:hypothetical protein